MRKEEEGSFLGFCFSIAVGITAAIFWGRHVNHLVSNAHSSYGPNHWIEMARTKAYGLCYNGCGDSCFYPSIIANACDMTKKVDLSSSNIICDASKIWFWAERYPFPCLEALGEIYKADAVWWRRFWLRGLYIFVPVFAGVAFLVVLFVTEWLRSSWKNRPYITGQRGDVGIKVPLLSRATLIALVLTILLSPATAYPCPSIYPPYDRLFASADGTHYGVIHAWLSHCFDETYSCGESCTTSPIDGRVICRPITCTRPHPFMVPRDFVNKAVWRVQRCGFRLVDAVPGIVDKRIPNPRIEESLWVKVSVNAFNSTDENGGGLDEGVRCLYEML